MCKYVKPKYALRKYFNSAVLLNVLNRLTSNVSSELYLHLNIIFLFFSWKTFCNKDIILLYAYMYRLNQIRVHAKGVFFTVCLYVIICTYMYLAELWINTNTFVIEKYL